MPLQRIAVLGLGKVGTLAAKLLAAANFGGGGTVSTPIVITPTRPPASKAAAIEPALSSA